MFKLSNICLKYVRHMLKSFVNLRTEYVKLIVLNFFQWLCKTQYSLFKVIVTCFLISFILMNSDFFVCLFFFSLFLMKSCFKFLTAGMQNCSVYPKSNWDEANFPCLGSITTLRSTSYRTSGLTPFRNLERFTETNF